jgi:hypothetical protein
MHQKGKKEFIGKTLYRSSKESCSASRCCTRTLPVHRRTRSHTRRVIALISNINYYNIHTEKRVGTESRRLLRHRGEYLKPRVIYIRSEFDVCATPARLALSRRALISCNNICNNIVHALVPDHDGRMDMRVGSFSVGFLRFRPCGRSTR